MPLIFQNTLILHILFGLLGIVFFTMALLGLMKNANLKKLKILSFFGLLSFLFSWFSGGYYYTKFYGNAVKPIIKAGNYGWVHSVIMETKEHIFLFLPFLSIALGLIIWFLGHEISKDPRLKKGASALALSIVILGIIITVMGLVISGAVK